MKTRILSAALLSASLFAFAACGQKDTQGPAAALDAKAVHEAVLTIDTHVDIPMNYMTDELDPGTATMSQVDLGKLETGGLDAAFFIV